MLYLEDNKLQGVLKQRGMSVSELAKQAGISRQSLYQMRRGSTVFNRPFFKLINYLQIDYLKLTHEFSNAEQIFSKSPQPIQDVIKALFSFCQAHKADLFLFGSRARGKQGRRSDWDFGVQFRNRGKNHALMTLRTKLSDSAFPYRADIVNLGDAPEWFLKSVEKDKIVLYGHRQ